MDILGCVIFAWTGLIAEWLFLTVLPNSSVANKISNESDTDGATEKEDHKENSATLEEQNKSIWNINLNDWFANRFPRSSTALSWVLTPLVLIGLFATRNDKSLAQSAFLVSLIYPGILQVFWMPKQEIVASIKERLASEPHAAPSP